MASGIGEPEVEELALVYPFEMRVQPWAAMGQGAAGWQVPACQITTCWHGAHPMCRKVWQYPQVDPIYRRACMSRAGLSCGCAVAAVPPARARTHRSLYQLKGPCILGPDGVYREILFGGRACQVYTLQSVCCATHPCDRPSTPCTGILTCAAAAATRRPCSSSCCTPTKSRAPAMAPRLAAASQHPAQPRPRPLTVAGRTAAPMPGSRLGTARTKPRR